MTNSTTTCQHCDETITRGAGLGQRAWRHDTSEILCASGESCADPKATTTEMDQALFAVFCEGVSARMTAGMTRNEAVTDFWTWATRAAAERRAMDADHDALLAELA